MTTKKTFSHTVDGLEYEKTPLSKLRLPKSNKTRVIPSGFHRPFAYSKKPGIFKLYFAYLIEVMLT